MSKVHPIWGEGVRASFYSARFAAEAIEEARKKRDYSRKTLGLYDALWHKKWGTNWRLSRIGYETLYNADDAQIDEFVKILRKIDGELLSRLYLGKVSKLDYLALVKILPSFMNPAIIRAVLSNL